MGIKDGYIALWKSGSSQPAEVFPYKVESLPLSDQKALEKGIPVETPEELSHLLEDYLS